MTYVVDGAIDHYDNHGNEGIIEANDALWLTAGRGVVHNEQPANGEAIHLLQLWVNLPAANKLVPSHFQALRAADMPVRHEPGAEIRVFSGASGSAVAPTTNYAPVTMVEARIEPDASRRTRAACRLQRLHCIARGKRPGSAPRPPTSKPDRWHR